MIHLSYIVPGTIRGAPAPETYRHFIERFAAAYSQFEAGHDHNLIIVNSNSGLTHEIEKIFSNISYNIFIYNGTGWDIGAHQKLAQSLPANDHLMCFSTSAYFRRAGWLKSYIEAAELRGDALYGSMGTFERLPHVRTTGFFLRAGLLQEYPSLCNSREDALAFESGENSLSQWILRRGLGVWIVGPKGIASLADCRKMKNVYRKGDQSNVWIYDRLADSFDKATPWSRYILEMDALDQRLTLRKRLYNRATYVFKRSLGI